MQASDEEPTRPIRDPVPFGRPLPSARPELLATLRALIAQHAGDQVPLVRSAPLRLDLEAIDKALGPAGLARDGLHEFSPAGPGASAATAGLMLAILARFLAEPATSAEARSGPQSGPRPVLWALPAGRAQDQGLPYGPGLAALGLAPERFMFVRARRDADVLWALEEGLKSRALAAVWGEVDAAGLTATRRLALAAAGGTAPVLLLRQGARPSGSAAATTWRVGAGASLPQPLDPRAPGRPSWSLELVRARQGRPGRWEVSGEHATAAFHLVAPLADRAPGPHAATARAERTR